MALRDDVTALLNQAAMGNQAAEQELIPLIYQELKKQARGYMRREQAGHTLQTTALVHEAYLKLIAQRTPQWQGRAQFFGISAQIMRRILIDHARYHTRQKRGGTQVFLPLDEALAFSPEHSKQLLRLDEALDRLSKIDPRQGRIVELRFFGGLSVQETSQLLGISPITVKRDWSFAKAWLSGEMGRDEL